MSDFFRTDRTWNQKYPGAKAGILVITGIENQNSSETFDAHRLEIENNIRTSYKDFSRDDINAIPTIAAYNHYYQSFGKTYHVRPQLESIIKGKSISGGSALLGAMFAAEIKNMLLTAGHDLDTLGLPVTIAIATGNETYADMRGQLKNTEAGDMIMSDAAGIISSVILGPDGRTKITPATKNVLFAVYAPAEIQESTMTAHLCDIEKGIMMISPIAQTEYMAVFEAK